MVMKPCGLAGERARRGAPARSTPARRSASWISTGRRWPERVLVEDVAVDLERVVDPDRLARDLLAVLVDREVGAEVGERAVGSPRRLEAEFLTSRLSGVPTGWTGRGLALAQEDDRLEAEGRRDGAAGQEQDQAEMGEQCGQLEVLVAVAVDATSRRRSRRRHDGPGSGVGAGLPHVVGASSGVLENARARPGAGRRTARLVDVDDAAPRHSRGVRSSVQQTMADHQQRQQQQRTTARRRRGRSPAARRRRPWSGRRAAPTMAEGPSAGACPPSGRRRRRGRAARTPGSAA